MAMAGLRILHVQDHTLPQMSGYAFRSRYLVRTLGTAGVEVEVVSSARHRDFEDLEELHEGQRYHRTPWPAGPLATLQLRVPFWRERVLTAALAKRVTAVAGRFRPHVIHAHSPIFDGQAALRAGRRLGIPVVYEIRAFWEDDAVDKRKIEEGGFVWRQVRRIESAVCRRADLVVTICEGLRTDLVQRGLDPKKILVVPNGVDGVRFEPAPADAGLRRRLGLEGCTVLGFVGSFFHYEGLPLLIEALGLLRDDHPLLRVVLVGGGEDEDRVRARVEALGLGGVVHMPGRVPHEEVASWYGLLDLLVYPRLSRRITELVTPLKPLEAMAMERSVLGSDVGGVKELLGSCGVQRLFRAGSADDLARAIRDWLAESPEQRRERAADSRRAVLGGRDWSRLLEPLLARYQALAARSRPAADQT